MTKKGIGERLGEAVESAKHKVNEMADRSRAEGHEFKSETSEHPMERTVEKGKAMIDHGKADLHEVASEKKARDAGR